MSGKPLHGVAHIRISEGPVNPREVYAVFVDGDLQSGLFASWAQAYRRFTTSVAGDDDARLTCTCPARLPDCVCAIDGVRNPRGAGRGRTAVRA